MTDAADITDQLQARVKAAAATCDPLYITAGGSKRNLIGRACDAQELDLSHHAGVIDYNPQELFVTVRAGTPLVALEALLAEQGQVLAFDPPQLNGNATVGGTLACNLSGPARPWHGSVRDATLGLTLIAGDGELYRFGGTVMKNVAGYDVSRLQAGALGTLGVITQVTLRVMPQSEATLTLSYAMSATDAIAAMNARAATPPPLRGAYWINDTLYLRLSGTGSAVEKTAANWGGDRIEHDTDLWRALRDMQLPFFQATGPLWRLSVGATTTAFCNRDNLLIDWCGSQQYLCGEEDFTTLHRQAVEAGGSASLWRGGDRTTQVQPPLDTVQRRLHERLKTTFDPQGIFNPGRLYDWM